MQGDLEPLAKSRASGLWVPTRPLGGWLITYGKLDANGSVTPTRDRDGQTFDAAETVGRIDWSDYLAKGVWNDTHAGMITGADGKKTYDASLDIPVGLPTMLEYHGADSALAKSHGKVGFWTEGALFDREDPRSWLGLGREPTEREFARADRMWQVATLLKGAPRGLGFSAEGKMLLSPCGSRILWAKVQRAAVCEVPVNPDATAMILAVTGARITPEMVGADPCADCRCPPGARCPRPVLAKATPTSAAGNGVDAEAITLKDERPTPTDSPDAARRKIDRLVKLLVMRTGCTDAEALTWIGRWLKNNGRDALNDVEE
jgi:hypothetical protein